MILVDANLLIYAFIRDLPQHEAARTWLDGMINEHTRVGLPWPSLLSFLRLTTSPRVFEKPPTVERAWEQIAHWLAVETIWVPGPTERHHEVLSQLLPFTDGRSDLVEDAHLAALAIEHGLILCSTDSDFARFPDLRWKNPIRGE